MTFSHGKKGVEQLSDMTIQGKNVIAKTNAGYFGGAVESYGLFVINGELIYDVSSVQSYNDYPALRAQTVDGKQQITATGVKGGEYTKIEEIKDDVKKYDWIISGSHALIIDGKIGDTQSPKNTITSNFSNPRTIVANRDDGSFVIVVIDGPIVNGARSGITINESAKLMESLKVQNALNLDGGPSSQMYVSDKLVSNTILVNGGVRSIGSALFVVER